VHAFAINSFSPLLVFSSTVKAEFSFKVC
jgi:hypothetical protein